MKINFKHLLTLILGFVFVALLVACEPEGTGATQFTVTFNSHGGTNVASQTVDEGSLLTEPTAPTRSGYTFEGWFKEAAYTNSWNFAVDTVTSNTTLHAKWEATGGTTEFTITFNVQGGAAVAAVTRASGAQIGTLPTTTRAGFSFDGWYLDEAGTQPVVTTAVVTANLTVFAKWTALSEDTFTVTFNAMGGDVLPSSRTVAAGTTVQEPDAEFIGHELVGWFTENTFVNQWNFATHAVEADMTLYAKWEAIPDGIAITTTEEFYNLVSGLTTYSAGDEFYLRFDLDFTDFEWDASGWTGDGIPTHNFNFNGNGKTIANLTFTAPNIGGLFARMSGGSVSNLRIDNVHITTGAQAAVLVGRIMSGSEVSFTDITILDSSATGGNVGVGALIGHVQGQTGKSVIDISGIVVLGTSLTSNSNAIGGLIGDIESSEITATDLLLDVVVTTTGERVGGIVGEARRNGSNANDLPSLTVDSAVVFANLTGLRYLGGIVGRADNNMLNLDPEIHGAASLPLPGSFTNMILVLNYQTTHASDNNNGHIARNNVPVAEDVYVAAFNYDRAALNGVNVAVDFVFPTVAAVPANAILGFTSNWQAQASALPMLNGYAIGLGHTVTLTVGETTQTQYVRDGQEISEIYINPALGAFVGWFDGETLFEGPVTANVALTAKFSEEFTVTFESNGGSAVAAQDVLEGEKATEPANPTRFGYTFDGWFLDIELTTLFDFNTPIIVDVTLYAGWTEVDLEEFTVSFESNGGSAVADIDVLDGGLLTLPVPPTRDGFVFAGWFTDVELEVAFVPATPITADITLYAKWLESDTEEPDGIAIFTAQQFYDAATGSNGADLSETYYLANDIDFTGFTWVGVVATFTGEMNGNGKTLSNLTYDNANTAVYNGLFHQLGGAKVHNFTIENFTFTSSVTTTRSAIIAGQVQGAVASVIENIVIRNSSISANEYVAAIVGRATGGTSSQVHIANIVLDNVSIKGYYVAGIIADLDATSSGSTISDIWAKVTLAGAENTRTTAERLGGIVSRARSASGSSVARVFMDITGTSDKWGAGIVADTSANGLSITDVFVTGTITTLANSGRAIAGANPANNVITNAYERLFTGNGTGGAGGTVVETAPDQAWWNTNMPNITQSVRWEYNETTGFYQLSLFSGTVVELPEPETFTVSFETDGGSAVADIDVEDGETLTLPADPTKEGFDFAGWFTDSDLENEFDEETPITADITLYAKWTEAVELEEFTVSFETNGGSEIADIQVEDGDTLTLPPHPTKEGFDFAGWFTDVELEVAFVPSTPITTDITLYAKWEEAEEVEIPDGFIGISSEQQFHDAIKGLNGYSLTDKYFLTKDLDFDGFVGWDTTNTTFAGEFDGNNKIISNLEISHSAVYGIFIRTGNGAVIKNLTINESKVTSTGNLAGLLIGQVDGNTVVSNVTIINSSVEGTQNNGVGLIAGRTNNVTLSVSDVRIYNSDALNNAKNVGAVVGRVDGNTTTIVNLLIDGFDAETKGGGNDSGAGVIIGYVVHDKSSKVEIMSAVVLNTTVTGVATQAVIGYYRGVSVVTIEDALIQTTFGTTTRSGFAWHNNTAAAAIDFTTVFVELNNVTVPGSNYNMYNPEPGNTVTVSTLDNTWWETNLPAIYNDSFFAELFAE